MSTYVYRALDADGRMTTGTDAAQNPRELVERLHLEGLIVTHVRELRPLGLPAQWREKVERVSSRDFALFFRQLGTLLAAGVPIIQSLSVLAARFPHPGLRRVLAQVRADLEGGPALSSAMARYPRHFSDLVVHAVHTGEAAGALDVLLRRLALHYEKEHTLRQKLRTAAVYPATVALVSVAAIVFLMIYVVPTLLGIYEGLEAALPWQTRLLLGVADGLRNYWPALLAAGAALLAIAETVRRTAWGREVLDRFTLSAPVAGRFAQHAVTSRFCRTLATLLTSGVPLLRALEVSAATEPMRPVARVISGLQEGVRVGERLGHVLSRQSVFSPLLAQMVIVGEESGNVDAMLDRVADFEEMELDYATAAMATALEPALILTMGAIVGFVVVSMYLPLFDLVRVVR